MTATGLQIKMCLRNGKSSKWFTVYLVDMEYQIKFTHILKALVKCFDKDLKHHSNTCFMPAEYNNIGHRNLAVDMTLL